MDKNIFTTFIEKKTKYNMDFVVGQIVGIFHTLTLGEKSKIYPIEIGKNGRFVTISNCSIVTYGKIKEVVEDLYPGLCRFNVTILEKQKLEL